MKNCRFFARILSLGLVLLIQACQLPLQTGGEPAARPAPGSVQPYSALVPSGQILRTRVNEPLLLKTYHMSRAGLDTLNVSVNQQPLPQENLSPQTPFFPGSLATVAFVVNGQEIRSGYVQPPYPTTTWTVPLIWTGHVPGTYDLVLQVTDKANETGVITQRIEVVGP